MHRSVCVSVCMLLLSMSFLTARAEHFVRVSAEASYVHDFAPNDAVTPNGTMSLDEARAWVGAGWSEPISKSNGWSPALGLGYRYMYKALVLDAGVGLEYRVRNNQPYDILDVKAEDVDDTGEPYMGTHFWTNRHTTLQNVGIHIPLMVGFEVKRFYMLAGIKANIDLWGSTYENGEYTMTGKYTRFMDEWEIDAHQLKSNASYETNAVGVGIGCNIRACGEVGYCVYSGEKSKFNTKAAPRYNIGAFVEYSFVGTEKQYLPLLAGVRLTVLFPISEGKKCNCLGY